MFKKTWKQIKILVVLIIILVCFPHSILPHRTDEPSKQELEKYIELNEREKRLAEFKDNDESLKLKIQQLEFINKSRKRNNAPALQLDILASRVANKMSREAAENEYIGHWNMAGEEPYLRYAFAGGYDHISENAYGEKSSISFNPSNALVSSLMKSGHDKFMAERAPNDGHKLNIINKTHNFVGIGYWISGKQFRYYEEYIDRYFEFENIPPEVKAGNEFKITVKTDGQSYLYYLIVYREDWPGPLSPANINRRGSYRDYTNDIAVEMTAWDLSRFRKGAVYEIPLSFRKEGLYYVQIFSDKKEITKPAPLSTKGKTPESGIVIKVDK